MTSEAVWLSPPRTETLRLARVRNCDLNLNQVRPTAAGILEHVACESSIGAEGRPHSVRIGVTRAARGNDVLAWAFPVEILAEVNTSGTLLQSMQLGVSGIFGADIQVSKDAISVGARIQALWDLDRGGEGKPKKAGGESHGSEQHVDGCNEGFLRRFLKLTKLD